MKKAVLLCAATLLLGAAAGFLNGIAGVGGGAVLVAGFSRVLPREGRRAAFAAAPAALLAPSLVSAARFLAAASAPPARLWLLIPFAAAGGFCGARFAARLSHKALARLFSLLVLAAGVIAVAT